MDNIKHSLKAMIGLKFYLNINLRDFVLIYIQVDPPEIRELEDESTGQQLSEDQVSEDSE